MLAKEFVKHIENTSNVCIYKLGGYYIPSNIFFPKATAVTLINCTKNGVVDILRQNIFPNVNKINYLSTNPSLFSVYKQFSSDTQWVFPNKNCEFYNTMIEMGKGKKDNDLIKQYIVNKKLINGKSDFDISFNLDLNIPEYGVVDGEWYCRQFYEYLVKKHNEALTKNSSQYIQEAEEYHLQREYVNKCINESYNIDTVDMIDVSKDH
jgi:hypothetical protein